MSEAAYEKLPVGPLKEFGVRLERRDVALSVSSTLAESMVLEISKMFESLSPGFLRHDLPRSEEYFVRTARLLVFEEPGNVYEVHDLADACFVTLAGDVEPRVFGFDGFGSEESGHGLHRLQSARAERGTVLLKIPKEIFVRYSIPGRETMVRQKLDFVELPGGLFHSWQPEKQYALAKSMRSHTVDKGRYLTQAGDTVEGVWFVVSGELSVGTALYEDLFATNHARTVDLALLTANDIFGISETFDKAFSFRTFANAVHDTRVLFLKTEHVDEFLFSDNAIKHALASLVASRKKWDEIMVAQAIANDNVHVAISHASMKLAKYSLADFVVTPSKPNQPRPSKTKIRPSRDDLREDEAPRRRKSSIRPINHDTLEDGGGARRRRSSTRPINHDTLEDGGGARRRRSSLTRPINHDQQEDEGGARRRRSSLTRRSSNASILQDLSHFEPGEEKSLLTEAVPSKAQLSKMMQNLESEIDGGQNEKEPPAIPVAEDQAAISTVAEAKEDVGKRWLSRFDAEKYTVLVVDDSKTTLNVLRWKFKKQGCEVSTANNGVEALELMRSNVYTLVVSDVMMPEMDGVTAVKQLRMWERENREGETQPVLLLTRIEESPVELEESELNDVGYAHKSENLTDVEAIVMRCFGIKKKEDWLSRFDAGHYTVLVVDDSKTTLNILQWKFKKLGCEVVTATNGLEALELMKQQLFAIVVSDVMMPEMDGVTAVTQLREWELENRPDDTQPVLLLTRIEESPVDIKQSALLKNVGFRHKSETLNDLHVLVECCLSNPNKEEI